MSPVFSYIMDNKVSFMESVDLHFRNIDVSRDLDQSHWREVAMGSHTNSYMKLELL